MEFNNFIQLVQESIQSRISPELKVEVQSIEKNNGLIYNGLVIIDPIHNISPTIYLEAYYQQYINGTPLGEIYNHILKTYYEFAPKEDFDISIFTDFEKAKGRIVMKLVNYEKNQLLLEKVPHVQFKDLAIVFLCSASDFHNEYATILIRHEHVKYWNIDSDTLYEIAKRNTPFLLPYRFESMSDFLKETCNWQDFMEDSSMYLLTNQLKINGACTILYNGLLKKIARQLDSDFVILPSSIHEVLILPCTSPEDLPYYSNMVKEVNTTQLSEDEILSEQAYYYSKEKQTII